MLGIHPHGELAQLLALIVGQMLAKPHVGTGIQHAYAGLVGIGAEIFQQRRPDLAARRVDAAQESVVIVGVDQQPQVGHQVLDLGARKE